ncbi:hypothetical protein L210DRAFT_3573138 [Boletus edulis BED1]|uniref:Uncharacterized protein n=1 Tax=Boletus edulis BED1 TaxID=1328754 RepID=A0AAD4BDU3_BOLED|nr:hypothetical protein L210DRAFT_3573138 [Boletus edulis BED1]
MSSANPAIAIIPVDLGTAAAFDQNIFPLAYYSCPDDFSKGSFLIRSTVEEMDNIYELGIDLNNHDDDFAFNTRVKVADLREEEAKLQRKTLNPFKVFRNYRARKLFHATSRKVYLDTIRTSEIIHREEGIVRQGPRTQVQVVPSTQMRNVNGEISPDMAIGGLCIELPNGPDDAERVIKRIRKRIDPFQEDPLVSQLRDGEQAMTLLSQDACGTSVDEANRTSVASSDLQQSRPSSPKTIIVIQNSVVTTNSSNISGITQNRGDRTSGASVTQGFAP